MKISEKDILVLKNCKELLLKARWEITGGEAATIAATLLHLSNMIKKIEEKANGTEQK